MTISERDPYEGARENAKGWLASIEEMVANYNAANDTNITDTTDAARDHIEDNVLRVMVRNGWRNPCTADTEGPKEYEILLTTDGPALRIFGRLDEHCEPSSAELQMQDWGTPWHRYPAPEATLLAFAQVFYFGD
jgi:hypothetical protein